MSLDLEAIQKDLAEFANAKAKATPGPWVRGEFYGKCYKHADGQHPKLMTEDPNDPCEATLVLYTEGHCSQVISSVTGVGVTYWAGEDYALEEENTHFFVTARNTPLEIHCANLLAEVKRLRSVL